MSSIYHGKNEDEALWKASQDLGVDPATIEYKILEEESEELSVALEVISVREELAYEEKYRDEGYEDSRDHSPRQREKRRREETEDVPRERRESWPEEDEIREALYEYPERADDMIDSYPETAKVVMVEDVISEREEQEPSEDAEKAAETVRQLLLYMGSSEDPNVEVREKGDDISIVLSNVDRGMVIGRKGRTIHALRYLVTKMIHKGSEEKRRIDIDLEGFEGERYQSLASAAQQLAEKSKSLDKAVRVQPMHASCRKVVHTALAKVSGVKTRSEGMGQFRRLLIIPSKGD